eukprot:XP_001706892.1 Hypothetical protein GL50803_26298 [Giardia lamblia ATCC 50803]
MGHMVSPLRQAVRSWPSGWDLGQRQLSMMRGWRHHQLHAFSRLLYRLEGRSILLAAKMGWRPSLDSQTSDGEQARKFLA